MLTPAAQTVAPTLLCRASPWSLAHAQVAEQAAIDGKAQPRLAGPLGELKQAFEQVNRLCRGLHAQEVRLRLRGRQGALVQPPHADLHHLQCRGRKTEATIPGG